MPTGAAPILPVTSQVIGGNLEVTDNLTASGGLTTNKITFTPIVSPPAAGQLYMTADGSLNFFNGTRATNLSASASASSATITSTAAASANINTVSLSAGAGIAVTKAGDGSYTIASTVDGADRSLSRLQDVAVNSDLLPGVNNTIDTGSTTNAFRNGYYGTAVYSPVLDTADPTTLSIGTTNATSINLGADLTTAAGKTVTVNGSALFRNAANSTTAFQVQDSAGVALLNADTTNHSLTATGALTVSGAVNANSTLNVAGALTAAGDASVAGTFTATGNATVGGTLTASGNATVGGTLNASGAANITGTLNANGAANVGGALTAGSTLHAVGAVTADSTLGVAGTLTASGALNVNGALTATGTALFRNTADSAAAFQIQNSAGVALLNANTTQGKISVGTFTPTVTVVTTPEVVTINPVTTNTYTTGTGPYSVTSADFNGDGKADLAVANRTANTVSVFIGTGTGTFAAKVDYTTGTGPFSVTAADFNGDGKADLAVVNNSSNTVSVFINTGTGTLTAKVDYAIGTAPLYFTAADFNGDGKADLAVTNNSSNTVSVFIGTGTGTFAAKVDYATGAAPSSVTTADFNGDSQVDLATAISSSGGSIGLTVIRLAAITTTVNTNTYNQSASKFAVNASAGTVGQIIQGTAGQTADLLQVSNDLNAVLFGVSATGTVAVANNATIGGTLAVAGAITAPSTLNVAGTLTVGGAMTASTTFNAVSGVYTGAGAGTIRLDAAGLLQNVSANVSILTAGSLGVARGGTGAGSFTSNGVVYGNGTGALLVTAAGTTGQCLSGSAGAPVWLACSGTTTLQNAYDNSATPATVTTSSIAKNVVVKSGTGYNSTTAFQVQNDAGASVLNVDTANGRIGVGTSAPTAELQVVGNINATGNITGGGIDVAPLAGSATNHYIWSASVGWIDLKPTYGNALVYPDHMEGYAYGENIGWIRLGTRTTGGVYSYPNDGPTTYGVNRNISTGALSGYAWSTTTGWINFSDTNSNVVHDPATFQYSGYAWAENTSWIHFKGTAADTTAYAAADNFGTHAVKAGDITGTTLTVGSIAATTAALSGNLSVMGNTGLGTVSPTLRLQVTDSQATGYVTSIINTSTSTTAKGLLIGLGIAGASRDPNNYFVGFADAAGTVAGKIQGGADSVAYTTTAADYSEYFKATPKDMPKSGELVMLDTTQNRTVTKSLVGKSSPSPLAGIVTTNPGFIGNSPICATTDTNCESDYAKTNALVALSGQVPAKVNTSGGAITIGDPITASSVAGEGAKATTAGYIVGYALEPLNSGSSGSGTIQVLVRPQHYTPGATGAIQGSSLEISGNASLAKLTVSGTATFTGDVSVQSIVVAKLTVNGHIITGGDAPTVTLDVGAGRADITQNLPSPTVVIEGNDTAGTVTITVGANPQADKLVTVTFASPFAARPRVSLTPITDGSARLQIFAGNPGPASFDISATQAPAAGKTYQFDYHIIQ